MIEMHDIDSAAKDMAYLYVFASVVGVLEGAIRGPASKDAEKIIAIAKAAQKKCFQRYDAAILKFDRQQRQSVANEATKGPTP